MAWTPSTDEVLDAINDAVGDTLTVGTTTLTWQMKIEGDPLSFLDEITEYPILIYKLGNTEALKSAKLIPLVVRIIINCAVHGSQIADVAETPYHQIRLVGEKLLSNIMSTGPRLGTNWLQRTLVGFGVDYATTNLMFPMGIRVYQIIFDLEYFEPDVQL